jgi:ethanolamine utilization protein EutQ (cupin superfamily)
MEVATGGVFFVPAGQSLRFASSTEGALLFVASCNDGFF